MIRRTSCLAPLVLWPCACTDRIAVLYSYASFDATPRSLGSGARSSCRTRLRQDDFFETCDALVYIYPFFFDFREPLHAAAITASASDSLHPRLAEGKSPECFQNVIFLCGHCTLCAVEYQELVHLTCWST